MVAECRDALVRVALRSLCPPSRIQKKTDPACQRHSGFKIIRIEIKFVHVCIILKTV